MLLSVASMAVEGDLQTIALAPNKEVRTRCYYNNDIHERNSKIGDHYTSAKFEYLAKARSCQILPGGGSEYLSV